MTAPIHIIDTFRGAERHQRIRSAPPSPSVAVAVADDASILGLLLPAVVLRVTVDAEAGRGELAGTPHLAELLRSDGADIDSRIALVLAHRVSPFHMSGGFQFSPPSVMFGIYYMIPILYIQLDSGNAHNLDTIDTNNAPRHSARVTGRRTHRDRTFRR